MPAAAARLRQKTSSTSFARQSYGEWHHLPRGWHAFILGRMTLALTDNQLEAVVSAARTLPVEKRDIFLRRIAAMLTLRGR